MPHALKPETFCVPEHTVPARRLWKVVQTELVGIADEFSDRRRTSIGSSEEIAEYDPQVYIVRENTNVIVTRECWLKRVGRLQKVESTRVREGEDSRLEFS